jgi:hypothetical protein
MNDISSNFTNTTKNTQLAKNKNIDTKAIILNSLSQTKENSNINQNQNINKSVNNIVKSLTNDLISGKKSEATILNLLKNSNTFKELTKVSKSLDSLISKLKSNPKLKEQVKVLEKFSINIKDLNGKNLKQQIQNSGIFLESKLQDGFSSNIQKDMKAILLQIQKELSSSITVQDKDSLKTVDKLLTQIDLNQLQSITSNNINLYMPFLWDICEDANIELKKSEDDIFYCDISLKLKDYGDINLSIILHDENKIDLSFYAEKKEFKKIVQDNIQDLKKNINSLNLAISSTKLLDLKKNDNNPYVCSNSNDISLDFDLKA